MGHMIENTLAFPYKTLHRAVCVLHARHLLSEQIHVREYQQSKKMLSIQHNTQPVCSLTYKQEDRMM